MKRLTTLALLVFLQSSGQGKWSEKARLPEPRGELGVATVNGKIYVLGGSALGEDAQTLNEEYDPATDRWQKRAPIPRGLSHAGAVGMNGKIYVVGGFTRNVHMGALDVAFEYDPVKDSWRSLAPMKSPRGSVGLAALNGKIHAIGGRGVDTVTVVTHEVYDPAKNAWSDLAPLPKARDHLSVIAVDGRIHAIGGRFNATVDNTGMHDVYDPATNSWKSAAPLPTPRSASAVTFYRGLILVAGGECNNGKTFVENEGYDPKADRWISLPAIPMMGRHGFRAVTIGDLAYFPGGAAGCGGGMISDTLLTFSLP
jgi:N-acetylneuraminic acid mutarotase